MLNQSTTSPRTGVHPLAPDPSFVLAQHGRGAVGHGVRQRWTSAQDAARALRTGRADVVVGCLPFDSRQPAALFEPKSWDPDVDDAASVLPGPGTSGAGVPSVRSWHEEPEPSEHVARVARAVELARAGALDKVVLARALRLELDESASALDLLRRFVADDREGNGYLVRLPRDGAVPGGHMVGSSPEALIRREGLEVYTHPLAGTAARRPEDRDLDREAALALQTSRKDLDEHRYVVDAIEAALRPLCAELDVPPLPTLAHTERIWHLGTPIRGVLADPAHTALDLAAALHPTPAVCGSPRQAALQHILGTESPRGYYAGAVGWCDASGDGHWRVLLRGGHLAEDGLSLTAHAGGGIVADSDPEAELAETRLKFTPVLTALGVQDRVKELLDTAPALPRSRG